MRLDEIWNLQKAQPFRPYELHVTDGTALRVAHPDFVARSPTGRSLVLYEEDGSLRILELMLISQVRVPASPDADPSNGESSRN